MLWLAQGMNSLAAHGHELVMRNRQDNAIVGAIGRAVDRSDAVFVHGLARIHPRIVDVDFDIVFTQFAHDIHNRSEEHTSELQSLMSISYAVFCLKKKII